MIFTSSKLFNKSLHLIDKSIGYTKKGKKLFIVSLTYICDLKEVDKILPEHVKYLKNQYEKGSFIASGRKIPRTGGIILSKLDNKEELEKVLNEDPFKINNIARYDIQEFIPSMTSNEFLNLKEE